MKGLIFKPASGIILLLLRYIRMTAIVMPWGVCYYRGALHDPLRRHEEVHWQQYQRYGRIRFPLLYFIEMIRKGYRNNKFEIEARRAE